MFRAGLTYTAVLTRSLRVEPGAPPVADVAWRLWLPTLPPIFGTETIVLADKPVLTVGPLTIIALVAGDPPALYLRSRPASSSVTTEASLVTLDPGSPELKWTTPAPPAVAVAAAPPPPSPPKVNLVGKPSPVVIVDRWVNQPPAVGDNLGGRALLIDFWATWCGPCKQSMPAIADLARELGGKSLTVVGVSIDEEIEPVEKFLKAHPIPYAIGWASADELGRFGESGIPTLVLVGPDGVVRMVHTGALIPADEIRKKVAELVKPPPPR